VKVRVEGEAGGSEREAIDVARELAHRAGRMPVTFVQRLEGTWLCWSVVEVDAGAVPGARRPRCLVFTREDCLRRVWDYPADWRTLDDAGLAALSWHR
jgi:hypothetical protein